MSREDLKRINDLEDVAEAARLLIKVKRHKDDIGKDTWYRLTQPIAWDALFKAISNLNRAIPTISKKIESSIANALAKEIHDKQDEEDGK